MCRPRRSHCNTLLMSSKIVRDLYGVILLKKSTLVRPKSRSNTQNKEPLRGELNANPLLFPFACGSRCGREAGQCKGSALTWLLLCRVSWKGTSQQLMEGPWKLRTIRSAQSWWKGNTGVQSLRCVYYL